ncbi:GNAT family N-acetyltransferase [Asanoa sp. NPDC050611]|uniref:GNAT family N-acetyltransferase n=1 Tax=Asanoa sp. NPDC050611 TaxID=3157098 RepID=UPI0033D3C6B6
MLSLQRLDPDHATELLRFERENRAYFARFISDRGDDYFATFAARHAELLAEQAAGLHHLHLLIDDNGAVLGRFNLIDVTDGTADLGFRMAEHAAGRGLATRTVGEICELARTAYGLHRLFAGAHLENLGSRTVLRRNGFRPTAEITVAGRPALHHVLDLSPTADPGSPSHGAA